MQIMGKDKDSFQGMKTIDQKYTSAPLGILKQLKGMGYLSSKEV